ncbi:MAG: 30S ribosomal protein S9 [Gemmatimonadetes bacterium]|nr:30S ribosomal protein S9 [Gemmatimonadota bacterium]
MRPGGGAVVVNGKPIEAYFTIPRHRSLIEAPLEVTESAGTYDVAVRVRGGGITGQAEAARLGVARALLKFDEERRSTLRAHGMLTRDARIVERKKPGRPKARKRFQFSKR